MEISGRSNTILDNIHILIRFIKKMFITDESCENKRAQIFCVSRRERYYPTVQKREWLNLFYCLDSEGLNVESLNFEWGISVNESWLPRDKWRKYNFQRSRIQYPKIWKDYFPKYKHLLCHVQTIVVNKDKLYHFSILLKLVPHRQSSIRDGTPLKIICVVFCLSSL